MYEKIKIFLVFFFSAILQVSFFPNLFFGHIAPDLVLLLIIILSFRKKFNEFWFWAAAAGLFLDIVSFEIIGLNSLIFMLIFWGVNFFAGRFFVLRKSTNFLTIAFFVFGGTIVNYLSLNFINNFANYLSFRDGFDFLKIFNSQILIAKILNNLLLFSIIYWPITQFSHIFSAEKNKLVVK